MHQNAKRRHLLFSQASTDKDEGAIRKDRAFCYHIRRFFATILRTVHCRDITHMPEKSTPRRSGAPCAALLVHAPSFLACLAAAAILLFALPCFAVTVRTMSDMRLWMTVDDRSAPLYWSWNDDADSATLLFSNRITAAVSTVNVARGAEETRGFCAQPLHDRETIVEVSLVQKAGGAEVSRETATLAYFDGAGGGPITVRATSGTREWERVRDPRVYAIDPAWQGESGESGYDIAWPVIMGFTIIVR